MSDADPTDDAPAGPRPVDLLIRAGTVLTVDDAGTEIADGAVAVHDGRIVAVGPSDEVVAGHAPARRVELPRHILMPGLVNAHTHLSMTMFRGLADDRDLVAFLDTVVPAEGRVLDATTVAVGAAAAAVESLRGGVTSAADMYFFHDAVLEAAGEVGLRVHTGPVVLDGDGPDGLPVGRRMELAVAWLATHPRRPGRRPVLAPHSTYLASPVLLSQVADLAADHDAAVHLHAAETAAEVADVTSRHGAHPVALLEGLGLLRPGTLLAHAVHLGDRELDLLADSGAAVAHCPASNLKLAAGVAPVPEMVAAGVPVGIGTDGAASSNDLDMFTAMRLTALVHKGTSGDPAALPARTVLRMATRGGASALGMADEIGHVAPGAIADLVAVDTDVAHLQPVHDAASALVYAAGRGDVTHVWVDGREVVVDRSVARVVPAEVVDALAALGPRVRAATAGGPLPTD